MSAASPTENIRSSIENMKIYLSLAAAVAMVAIMVSGSFWAYGEIDDGSNQRLTTRIILDAADELMSSLRDAETGERGYALTGNEIYLAPYLAVRDAVPGQVNTLRRLTLKSPSAGRVATVTPIVAARMAELAEVIRLRQVRDVAAMMRVISGGAGKAMMDSIRFEMREIIKLEDAVLADHEAAFGKNMHWLFMTIVGASLLTLGFAVSFGYLIFRQGKAQSENRAVLDLQKFVRFQEEANLTLQQSNVTLQISEEKLAVTLSSIGDGVITTDAQGRVTLLNDVAEKLTGWTNTQAQARPVEEIFKIINQETRQPSKIPVQEALAKGTVQGIANHTVLISRNGSECAIADSCAPIRGRDGAVIGAVMVFRDVTDEYAVQQRVRDGAAQLAAILDTVVDGIVTLRADGGVIDTANVAAEAMFGYRAAELAGKSVGLLIPELEWGKDGIGSLDLFRPGTAARSAGRGREVSGRRKDGTRFMLEIAASEMTLGGKRYFTAIVRDITARKAAEEEILKAGALQQAIFNSANFSSIATDARGVIQIFNVGAERMLGYRAADVLNKITPADISDAQEVQVRARTLSAELSMSIAPGFDALVFKASRGIEDIYELTYIRKDGSRFPAIVSVTALRDADNAIIGYLLIGTDNTVRKQVEDEREKLDQRLRDQQFYTRSLIESNTDALVTTDISGIVTDVNKQMEALTGCTRDELIGAPFKNHFTDPDRADAAIRRVLSEKKLSDYELTASAPDGSSTVVSYNASTFYDRDRKLQGVVGAARDVTERKRLDRELREKNIELEEATTAAEKANLAKSEFLSSMSHELRSPLNGILGFAQLMESDSPAPSASQAESIAQILQAGWHLLRLINEILDLAKVESGRVPMSQEPVSMTEVLGECQGMIEPQAQQRGVTLVFPDVALPYFALADRTRVKQVLINLLSNAVKYNVKQGRVTVTCAESGQGRIRVGISDTGAGLYPEQLAQLFQPFNRLGQEAGGEEGTGIGLVVAKRLVELMGGSIGVKSVPGQGSEFWFDLATAAEPVLVTNAGGKPDKGGQRGPRSQKPHTMLYVEDNPAMSTSSWRPSNSRCNLSSSAGLSRPPHRESCNRHTGNPSRQGADCRRPESQCNRA